jgi:hopanoid C-3 methylase
MNILLINPPRSPENAILAHAPEAAKRFIHKKLIGPPLGLLTIAASVKDHNVTVIDMKAEYDQNPAAPLPAALIRDYCEKTKPDIAAITCIASEFPDSLRLLEAVKQWDPYVLTVAGGLHATLCPHDFKGTAADIVCVGQAGHTFRRIVESMSQRTGFTGIGGIFRNAPEGFVCQPGTTASDRITAEGLILPDRSFIRQWLPAYRMQYSEKNITYINTSFGCPFTCSFCSIWPQYNGRYYLRDVESIINELRSLTDYGIVRFADANSVIDEAHTHRLFSRIEEERLGKEFVMDIRVDTAAKHPKLVKRMARAGLKVVICGFESFRKNELSTYNKQLDPRYIGEAISVFHDNGIMVRGNYVVPPDYSEADFDALAEFAGAQRVTYAGYTVLTPMPGTEMHRALASDITDHDLRKYNFFNCVLKTRLPIDKFHEKIGALWLIKKGTEIAE